MDSMENLILCLVSISVFLSLIRDHFLLNFVRDESGVNVFLNSEEIGGYNTDENRLNVNADDEAEKQVICENSVEETEWIDDDDWVGIERSELDKVFGEAMVFVSGIEDVKKVEELCHLQQLVLQGPSPSNSRSALEGVSRETAMKKYIELLSDAIPGWKRGFTSSL